MLTVDNIKKKVIPILECYGVKKAALFGSFVRGKMKRDLDVSLSDILESIEKIEEYTKKLNEENKETKKTLKSSMATHISCA
ncbi:MAG: nucleotidyltransferase domain-containing protein [Candidatus Anstonellales archaeon]